MAAVRDAVPSGGSEQDVITFISRPMWRKWCEDLGIVEKAFKDDKVHFLYPEPSKFWGPTHARVYGSVTVVVESELYFAISRARQKPKKIMITQV